MNLKKLKIERLLLFIENKPWTIFIFFVALLFTLFQSLFKSYFVADEWVHFTYFLPLTKNPNGFFTAFISTFVNTGFLTGDGQHVNPIATAIFFLNTKFFGLNFAPYAFMALLLHALNSFLVFVFIKTLLRQKQILTKNIFGILGGIFFALAPTPMHTITGAAAFYSSNVLSVTFFMLCVILFRTAFIKKQKKLIYYSVIFLFLALFSKETTVFLFVLLPFMVIIEKRIFPLKFLLKLYATCLIVYLIFRFIVPNFSNLPQMMADKLFEMYMPASYHQPIKQVDTGTIVSRDLSIYENLPGEVLLRTITFPIRMTGTLFLPRQTVSPIVQFITPVVVPIPPGGDITGRLGFIYGSGNYVLIYLVSIGIIIFCVLQIKNFLKKKQTEEARTLFLGMVIIVLSSMPLVAIIFSFPRWGYDFYFDSRHYYNPTVGAAIVFPFLLFALAKFISKTFRIRAFSFVVLTLFIIWLINNMYIFSLIKDQFVSKFGSDRREVVDQIKNYLPILPQETVFYFETDGLSAYGPNLPFETSVPQALTVVYYDKNPLPDSFFNKTIFDGKSHGYLYSDGRGFGYFTSKKTLSEALTSNSFSVDDVYGFYYYAQKVKLKNITSQIREEMRDYLKNTDISQWKSFGDPLLKIKFRYPLSTQISESKSPDTNITKSLIFNDPQFRAEVFSITVSSTFNIQDSIQFPIGNNGIPSSFKTIEKEVFFDKYHSNKVVITEELEPKYFMRFNDILIYVKMENNNPEAVRTMERILGSLEIINDK